MFVVSISDVFSYAGLTEIDMTKVAVAMHESGLTKVTSGAHLGL